MSDQNLPTAKVQQNSSAPTQLNDKLDHIKVIFANLARREKIMVLIAIYLVAGAFIWWVLLSPAIQILKNAPAQHLVLDQEIQSMQQMVAEAKTIQAQAQSQNAPANFESTLKLLSENTIPGQYTLLSSGDKITITLQNTESKKLLQWLEIVRTELHNKPQEIQLKQVNNSTLWQGTVVFLLPKMNSK